MSIRHYTLWNIKILIHWLYFVTWSKHMMRSIEIFCRRSLETMKCQHPYQRIWNKTMIPYTVGVKQGNIFSHPYFSSSSTQLESQLKRIIMWWIYQYLLYPVILKWTNQRIFFRGDTFYKRKSNFHCLSHIIKWFGLNCSILKRLKEGH